MRFGCHHHHLDTFVCDSPERLDELHYRDMIAEIIPGTPLGGKNAKLPYRDWSKLIPFVQYEGCKGNTLKFFVPNKYNGWDCYIQFDEWFEQVQDTNINAVEAARLLLWGGNLRLHCNCPSFSFWGYNYILDQMDAAIYPETRFPKVRNPELKGVGCKHLRKVLKTLAFRLGSMAAAIKEQRKQLMNSPAADDKGRWQS